MNITQFTNSFDACVGHALLPLAQIRYDVLKKISVTGLDPQTGAKLNADDLRDVKKELAERDAAHKEIDAL